jgi:hypothetical protein
VSPHPDRREKVFVNCPFDSAREAVFDALIFALFCCAARPVTAAHRHGDGESRLDYIIRQLQTCRYSVHDITPVKTAAGECRHNMAFELGICFGANRRGGCLILAEERAPLMGGFSDLDGVDPTVYGGGDKCANIVRQVAQWLARQPDFKGKPLPRPAEAQSRYEKEFRPQFRAFCEREKWQSGDNLSYKVKLIGEWVAARR